MHTAWHTQARGVLSQEMVSSRVETALGIKIPEEILKPHGHQSSNFVITFFFLRESRVGAFISVDSGIQ